MVFFSNFFQNVYNTILRNFAGRQIFAIYLSSKSFKEVLKCGNIHILQIQLNLQFTPNSQDDGMVNVLHMPNSTAEVKKKTQL